MMPRNWILYLAAFAMAFAVSLLTTPMAKNFAIKVGAIDYPKSRGMNKEPMPRMGGLAIVCGFLVSVVILFPFLEELRTKQFVGFVIGALLIVILGMLDDIYELSAKYKLVVQILAAVIVVYSGTRIDVIMWPFWQYLKPLSPLITILWIIGLTNAVNLIDGIDGLAAGVTSISAISLMILCIISGSELAVVLAATLAGACLGFLPRNFSPAEIYMGDTGATFLGYVLAVSSCIGVYKSYAILSIVIAILAIALPILDTLFAMIRRLINHQPIMTADRGHLHHRLIDSGYSHKQAVIILYALSVVSAIIAILIAVQNFAVTIVVFISFSILLLMFFVYSKRTDHNSNKKNSQLPKDESKDSGSIEKS